MVSLDPDNAPTANVRPRRGHSRAGVVPHAAVAAFLGRQRDDFRRYKRLTAARIEQLVALLPQRPPHWHKLKRHQKLMVLVGARHRRFAFFAATGTGKTLTALSLAQYHGLPTLVLVPNRSNKEEWRDEIAKHTPHLPAVVLDGSSVAKQLTLSTTRASVVIETYPGLVRMLTGKVRNRHGGYALKPVPGLVDDLCRKFGAVVFDESTQAKTQGSLTARICRKLSEYCRVVYTLTGTPMGHDPTDLHEQMFLVDRGHSLGETLGLFRAAFFTTRPGFAGFPEYIFDGSKERLLNRLLAHRSLRIVADEADLPGVVAIRKFVTLPQEAGTYHQRAIAAIKQARQDGDVQAMRNVFVRLRQMSSGFIGYRDDGARAQFAFAENPKLDLLIGLLADIGSDKALVFYEFTWSAEAIAKRLADARRDFAWLHGGIVDPALPLRRFKTDPRCPILLLQNQFGLGLNLQMARYGIFYESPVPGILRAQCEARFIRQHSAHRRVFRYDLICKGTVDESILRAHELGVDLAKAVIDGQVKLST